MKYMILHHAIKLKKDRLAGEKVITRDAYISFIPSTRPRSSSPHLTGRESVLKLLLTTTITGSRRKTRRPVLGEAFCLIIVLFLIFCWCRQSREKKSGQTNLPLNKAALRTFVHWPFNVVRSELLDIWTESLPQHWRASTQWCSAHPRGGWLSMVKYDLGWYKSYRTRNLFFLFSAGGAIITRENKREISAF